MQNISVPNLTIDHLPAKNLDDDKSLNETTKSKTKQKSYVHASNPSLCISSESSVSNFNKTRTVQQGNDNLAGFVTLEELMNRQAEERKLNPHCTAEDVPINLNLIKPDVVYGKYTEYFLYAYRIFHIPGGM